MTTTRQPIRNIESDAVNSPLRTNIGAIALVGSSARHPGTHWPMPLPPRNLTAPASASFDAGTATVERVLHRLREWPC